MPTHALIAASILTASGLAAAAADPQQTFDSVYGAQYRAATQSRATDDDLALAGDLIKAGQTLTDAPALRALLYEKAFELAKRDAGGLALADTALTNLAAADPSRAADAAAMRMTLYEEQYRRAGDQRQAVGQLLIEQYLTAADALLRSDQIDEAFVMYRKAATVARVVGSPRQAEIASLQRQAAARKRILTRMRLLLTKLEADASDIGAAKEVVETYLVELDDPKSAARLAAVTGDDELKQVAALAVKPLDELGEAEARRLAEWYDAKSGSAAAGQLTSLARAEQYYTRFIELHTQSDAAALGARVGLQRVQKQLDGAQVTTTLLRSASDAQQAAATPAAPTPAPAAQTTGVLGAMVCETLAAKRAPSGLSSAAIAFEAPRGDGRSGANGIALEVDTRAPVLGTRWSGRFRRSGSARGLQLIHPFKGGHVIVTVSNASVVLSTDGPWRSHFGWDTGVKAQTTPDFAKHFPLTDGKDAHLISQLAADGTFQFFVDNVLVAAARIGSAKPLALTDDFKSNGEPVKLKPNHAAAVIGPRDSGENVFSDVHFYPPPAQ